MGIKGLVEKGLINNLRPFWYLWHTEKKHRTSMMTLLLRTALLLGVALIIRAEGCDDKYQFTCGSGECISKYQRCDQESECADESDEKDCTCTKENNGFQCSNGECVFFKFECDGEADCEDGSDEKNC